jgi:NAD+ synthase
VEASTLSLKSIRDQLQLEPGLVVKEIGEGVRRVVSEELRRRGLVVGISGGVDSSVCAALAVHALGPKNVFGLLMPESDSAAEDTDIARSWAEHLGIPYAIETITPALKAVGCYARRDESVRRLVPGYGPGWRCKIGLGSDRYASDRLAVFHLTVQSPDGELSEVRLPPDVYREVVAATNFKQRVRKMLEYYHADRLHYAVLGTPNRLEYDQGFFVKGGDGLADLKPIAHLYKTQVYQLAEHLSVPQEVLSQAPTTGTYSLPQTQQEFFFSLPLQQMDAVLYGFSNGVPAEQVAAELDVEVDRVERVYRDIERKRSTTRYLHLPPILLDVVEGVG